MPEKKSKKSRAARKGSYQKARIRLVGRDEGDEQPQIAVYALDRSGEPITIAQVNDEGRFDLPGDSLEKAHRIVVGPQVEDLSEVESRALTRYRPHHFASLLEEGVIDVARDRWVSWLPFYRCVSGTVRHCRPWPFVAESLLKQSSFDIVAGPDLTERVVRDPAEFTIGPLTPAPLFQICRPVCDGLVEVYRRVCCCDPWIVYDPRLPILVDVLEDLVPRLEPEIPEIGPIPRPDPPPIQELEFVEDGTVDQIKLNARRDLQAIRSLEGVAVHEYIQARPYLWCLTSCGPGTKVASGLIQADGEFQVCWSEYPIYLLAHCHWEYAFVVKQVINGQTVTIYNGPAANQWFDADDDMSLVSYHPDAVTCGDEVVPEGPGAYAVLQDIGLTHSYRLKTPDATGWDRVANPGYNDGLADPVANPADAVGKLKNRNWGGLLRLRYHFSESMRNRGAKYFRVTVTEADGNGNPIGPRTALQAPTWKQYVSLGGGNIEIENISLGPHSVGGEDNLFEIPYDNALPNNREWLSGLFHAHLPTTDFGNGRHLLTLEVFDQTGKRLRPNGVPGAGKDANFTFRRWFQETGPTANVPFAALTHLLWWDNRNAVAHIDGLLVDGNQPSDADCQFLEAESGAKFAVRYNAYHPEAQFLQNHTVWWRRGLNGPTGTLTVPHPKPGDAGPPPEVTNKVVTFGNMLGGEEKCSFALTVHANVKTFDGIGTLNGRDGHDVGSFALLLSNP